MRHAPINALLGLITIVGITSLTRSASAQAYIELGQYLGTPGQIVNYYNCVGVSSGNMSNGTPFVWGGCNALPENGYTHARDQALSFDTSDCIQSGGFSYCSLRDAMNYTKCMGVSGGSKSNQAAVKIWDCLGTSHPDQYWLLFPDNSTGCNIVYNYNSGMRLAMPDNLSSINLVQSNSSQSEWCPHTVAP
ncbi:MAG TPA: hypothetical protein VHM31_03345 [Polyangia bacterium]|nr:hypothetical protein [Polyangia bacterium]